MSIYKEQRQLIGQKIIAKAVEIFRDKGYEKATIDEITKAVGIAKGTFYNFFSSKSEVLLAWAQERFQSIDLQQACAGDETVEKNLYAFTSCLVKAIENEGQLFYSFLQEILKVQGDKEHADHFDFISIYGLIINRSRDSAKFCGPQLETKIHVLNSSLFIGLINWFAAGKTSQGLETYLQEIIKICLYGIMEREER